MKKETNLVQKEKTYFMAFGNEAEFDVPLPIEKIYDTTSDDKFVPYGEDNCFPQRLLDLIESTSLVETIIDKITKFIFGQGFQIVGYDITAPINTKGQTWEELLKHLVSDYIAFGAFAVQVRRNKIGDIKYLDYIPVERLRTNEENTKFWYKKRWSKYGNSNIVYDAFTGSKLQNNSIFYFKSNMRHVYGRAYWWSSLDDLTIMSAISDFDLSHVNNNFAPSAVVSFVEGVPSEDEQADVEKKVNKKFSGAKNASKAIFTFSDSAETAPKITLLNPTDLTSQYTALLDKVRENIFAAFAMNSNLLGLQTKDGVFNSEQYDQIYNLFNKTQIEPMQKEIIKAMKKLGYELIFNAFEDNAASGESETENNIVTE